MQNYDPRQEDSDAVMLEVSRPNDDMATPKELPPAAEEVGFGQADTTDGRARWEWRSRYPSAARKAIRTEAAYLAILLGLLPLLIVVFWLEYPMTWLSIPESRYRTILKFFLAWLSGTLGGVLFALKWLYHSVARGSWHLDRRLWRLFTPHISGGLSFSMLALVSSGAIRIFDTHATRSLSLVVGFGFLVGYFSDSAIAKLNDVADTLFGTVQSKVKLDRSDDSTDGHEASGRFDDETTTITPNEKRSRRSEE